MNRDRCWLGLGLLVALLALILPLPAPAQASDSDADGVPDAVDNCRYLVNRTQLDTDCDGFGDRCDKDFDNNGIVTGADYAIIVAGPATNILFDVAAPFNGVADAADQAAVLSSGPPGPSGGAPPGAPSCAPSALSPPYYCITGNPTGANYSWQLSGGSLSTPHTEDPVAGSLGTSAQHLMLNFQWSIEAVSGITGVTVDAVSFGPPNCFKLSDANVTLTVGPPGNPTACAVDPGPCSFNPIIYKVEAAGVPALSTAATAVLAALLCGAGFFAIARRPLTRR